ncbi:unnamed protein product [Brassica oleracea var. botrytis]
MPPSLSPSLRSTPVRSRQLIGNPISHRSHHGTMKLHYLF